MTVKGMPGKRTLVPGGVCRAGHPIATEADLVSHGGRARCRACVQKAHDEWSARGRMADHDCRGGVPGDRYPL